MRRTVAIVVTLLVCLAVASSLASYAYAQEKAAPAKPKLDRVMGIVQRLDKAASTMEVKEDKTNVIRVVVYNEKTVFTKAHEAGGGIGDVEQGTKVTCVGKFEGQNRLVATKINIREPRK